MESADHIKLTETYAAHNYAPLDVVLTSGQGVWVSDVAGKRYLDMLSAYSAMNFGHSNKRLTDVAVQQLNKLSLTSRAFYNDQFGPFCQELAEFCQMEMVLVMNSGAEAVETAIKAARKWGYEQKRVEPNQANIIVFENNFAGRTTTIVSFSTDPLARAGFGPFTPGFKVVPFGDIKAVCKAIDANTVGVLIEPIQGEGGVLLPPQRFFSDLREACSDNDILLITDEIQTGLCRTGRVFAFEHEGIRPDMLLIGKSLGGGLLPVSAVVSSRSVLGVFTPGSHGSTFGGNPLACAVAREVLRLIKEEQPEKQAARLGAYFMDRLRAMNSEKIAAVRGRGLMVAVDIAPQYGKAKQFCLALKEQGLLCKDTHEKTIRFAPPLIIQETQLDWACEKIAAVLT